MGYECGLQYAAQHVADLAVAYSTRQKQRAAVRAHQAQQRQHHQLQQPAACDLGTPCAPANEAALAGHPRDQPPAPTPSLHAPAAAFSVLDPAVAMAAEAEAARSKAGSGAGVAVEAPDVVLVPPCSPDEGRESGGEEDGMGGEEVGEGAGVARARAGQSGSGVGAARAAGATSASLQGDCQQAADAGAGRGGADAGCLPSSSAFSPPGPGHVDVLVLCRRFLGQLEAWAAQLNLPLPCSSSSSNLGAQGRAVLEAGRDVAGGGDLASARGSARGTVRAKGVLQASGSM